MFVPRPYQDEAVQKLFQYFQEQNGNPLVLMPTGTGKSLVIALFAQVVLRYPNQRVLVLTHVKELVKQNYETACKVLTTAQCGVYAAGLKRREHYYPVTFGSAQTVVNVVEKFGRVDILMIDEAHLLSPEDGTRYQTIIRELMKVNPFLKIIGYSATGYRPKQGMLIDATIDDKGEKRPPIFTHVAADYTTPEAFSMFFANNWLVRPIPKRTKTILSTERVKVIGGEFNAGQMQKEFNTDELNRKVLEEFCNMAWDRKAWLLFCSGIKHSDDVAAMLNYMGVPAGSVHSKSGELRDKNIELFKAGELRALTSNGVLTTGFDHKPVDAIALMRATLSTSLHVQIIGRGMRPFACQEYVKQDCLVADFVGNTNQCGPIDEPYIPKPSSKGKGDAPVKICPACDAYNHARVKFCFNCNHEFTFDQKLSTTASTTELISGEAPILENFDVDRVVYGRVVSKGSDIPMVKVSYFCDTRSFSELVMFDHNGYAKKRALDWWRIRFPNAWEPTSTDEALNYISYCRTPRSIRVHVNKRYPEVMSAQF